MLDTTKTIINNLNQFKFLKNIDRVTLEKETSTETNNIVNESGSKDKIMKLQGDMRVSNLKTFAGNYFTLRAYRFVVVTLPALLSAAAIWLVQTPSRVDKNDTAHYYVRNETIYDSDAGVSTTIKDTYDLGDSGEFFGHQLVQPENGEVITYASNKILIEYHNGEKCLTADLKIDGNGEMTVSSADVVNNYIDINNNDGLNFQDENDDEYVSLFDRALAIIEESSSLSKDEKELLDSITNSEKQSIILNIVTYQDKGNVEVILSKTRIPRKVILGLIAFIYDVLLIASYNYRKEEFGTTCLDHKNGTLVTERDVYDGSVWFSALKMKEAFLAAEKERILLLNKEIVENVRESDRNKLLTSYEKKLIKKAGKKLDR